MDHDNLIQQVISEIANQIYNEKDTQPNQKLLDEKTAASVLGVKPGTLCNWRCTGRYNLPHIKTGRLVRYRITDLAEWIIRHRSSGAGG